MSIFTKKKSPVIECETYDLNYVSPVDIMYDQEVIESYLKVAEAVYIADSKSLNGEPVMEALGDVVESILKAVTVVWDKIIALITSVIDFFLSFGDAVKEFISGVPTKGGSPGVVKLWKKPEVSEMLDRIIGMAQQGLNEGRIINIDKQPKDAIEAATSQLEAKITSKKMRAMSDIIGKDISEAEFKNELTKKLLGEEMEEKRFQSPRALTPLLQDALKLMEKPKSYKQTLEQLKSRSIGDLNRLKNKAGNLGESEKDKTQAITRFIRIATKERNILNQVLGQVIGIWKTCVVKYTNQIKKGITQLAKGESSTNQNNTRDFKQRAKDRVAANKKNQLGVHL